MTFKPSKQSGLTLVEVLATIVILAIVSAIIFSIMFSGLRISKDAENTANLQQEANYVIALLKEAHEKGIPYSIQTNSDQTKVFINQQSTTTVGSGRFVYEIADAEDLAIKATNTNIIKIIPKNENFNVQLTITLKDNPSKTYTIITILSRL